MGVGGGGAGGGKKNPHLHIIFCIGPRSCKGEMLHQHQHQQHQFPPPPPPPVAPPPPGCCPAFTWNSLLLLLLLLLLLPCSCPSWSLEWTQLAWSSAPSDRITQSLSPGDFFFFWVVVVVRERFSHRRRNACPTNIGITRVARPIGGDTAVVVSQVLE